LAGLEGALAAVKLHRTIPAVKDTIGQIELDRKRDLLKLREQLNDLKWCKAEVAPLQAVVDDPKQQNKHEWARRCLDLAERAIAARQKAVDAAIRIVELRGEGIELHKPLEALEN
jgi:hypothetical protein